MSEIITISNNILTAGISTLGAELVSLKKTVLKTSGTAIPNSGQWIEQNTFALSLIRLLQKNTQ